MQQVDKWTLAVINRRRALEAGAKVMKATQAWHLIRVRTTPKTSIYGQDVKARYKKPWQLRSSPCSL